MTGLYTRWLDRWERRLATRDTNRVVRPFDWGTEWLERIGFPALPKEVNGDAAACVSRYAAEAIRDSTRFYSYAPVADYRLDANRLTFSSAAPSGCPENDTVQALWLPAPKDRDARSYCFPNGITTKARTWGSPNCSTGSVSARCA